MEEGAQICLVLYQHMAAAERTRPAPLACFPSARHRLKASLEHLSLGKNTPVQEKPLVSQPGVQVRDLFMKEARCCHH